MLWMWRVASGVRCINLWICTGIMRYSATKREAEDDPDVYGNDDRQASSGGLYGGSPPSARRASNQQPGRSLSGSGQYRASSHRAGTGATQQDGEDGNEEDGAGSASDPELEEDEEEVADAGEQETSESWYSDDSTSRKGACTEPV